MNHNDSQLIEEISSELANLTIIIEEVEVVESDDFKSEITPEHVPEPEELKPEPEEPEPESEPEDPEIKFHESTTLIKKEDPLVIRRISDLVVSVFRFFTQTVGQTGIAEQHVDLMAEATKDSTFWSHAEFHVHTTILQGFKLVKVLVAPAGSMETLFGVVLKHKEDYYIVFRGSQVAGDWWANFNFRTVEEMGFWLQAGYVEFFRSIRDQLMTLNLHHKDRIYVCGHSLGGALASLCAVYLYQHGFHRVQLYMFGSPKVGDHQFAGYIKRSFKAFHFQRETDLTPVWGTKWSFVNVGEVIILPSQVSRLSVERSHDVREYRRGIYELLGLRQMYRPLYLKTKWEIMKYLPPVLHLIHFGELKRKHTDGEYKLVQGNKDGKPAEEVEMKVIKIYYDQKQAELTLPYRLAKSEINS